jgi:hypothetical protein
MKNKFFSISFSQVSRAHRRFGGGDNSNTRPFLAKEKEQAEAGQSPALLALHYRYGVLRILRGYLTSFLLVK